MAQRSKGKSARLKGGRYEGRPLVNCDGGAKHFRPACHALTNSTANGNLTTKARRFGADAAEAGLVSAGGGGVAGVDCGFDFAEGFTKGARQFTRADVALRELKAQLERLIGRFVTVNERLRTRR
jgi:hypothetical protein